MFIHYSSSWYYSMCKTSSSEAPPAYPTSVLKSQLSAKDEGNDSTPMRGALLLTWSSLLPIRSRFWNPTPRIQLCICHLFIISFDRCAQIGIEGWNTLHRHNFHWNKHEGPGKLHKNQSNSTSYLTSVAVEQYASTICIKASNQDLSKGRPCKCAPAQSHSYSFFD